MFIIELLRIMRKALVVITVAFVFLCGIIGKNSVDKPLFTKTTTCIENIEEHAFQTTNNSNGNYFISTNISNPIKIAINEQNSGAINNNNFQIRDYFFKEKNNLKKIHNANGQKYTLALSPRAP